MFACTVTPSSLNLFINGKRFSVNKTHVNYDAVLKAVRAISLVEGAGGESGHLIQPLLDLVDIRTFVARVTEGKVKIGDDIVTYDGKEIKGVIVDRILQILNMGLDVRPMAKFLDRLRQNPDLTAYDEVLLFLESGNMPITSDGCFLAYKYVRDDYYSCHSGRGPNEVRNRIGDTPSMERNSVCSDRTLTCERGLHFCSAQYLVGNANHNKRLMIVKVAPEDVVSIPVDYNNSKGRAWRYVVIAETSFDGAETRFDDRPVVASEGIFDAADEDYGATTTDAFGTSYPVEGLNDCETCDTTGCEGDCDEERDEKCPNDPASVFEDVIEARLAEKPVEEASSELTFKAGKKILTAVELRQLVDDYGQRGVSRMIGVPRSTIQDWLKRASA